MNRRRLTAVDVAPMTAAVRRHRAHRRPAGPIALIAAIIRNMPKFEGAICAEDPRLWDGATEDDRREAIRVCVEDCGALHACTVWYRSLPQGARPSGVVAGRFRGGRRSAP
jgi:hypothetical protein